MTTSQNGNDYERLKEELRRLKRRGAPWYFESALHQRLHGMRKGRSRLRPISTTPVVVLAVVTLCILALVTYVFFVRTNLFSPPGPGTPAGPGSPASPDTLRSVRETVPAGHEGRESHPGVPENTRPSPRTAPEIRRTADTAVERREGPVRDDTLGRPVHTFQRADTGSRSAPPHPAGRADTIPGPGVSASARRDTSAGRPDTSGRPSPVRPPQ